MHAPGSAALSHALAAKATAHGRRSVGDIAEPPAVTALLVLPTAFRLKSSPAVETEIAAKALRHSAQSRTEGEWRLRPDAEAQSDHDQLQRHGRTCGDVQRLSPRR
jgi:hypothetical protein